MDIKEGIMEQREQEIKTFSVSLHILYLFPKNKLVIIWETSLAYKRMKAQEVEVG